MVRLLFLVSCAFVFAECLPLTSLRRRATLGDKLYVIEILVRGDQLLSSNGRYSAALQTDGNFVVRRLQDDKALWATGTSEADRAVLQTGGKLVLYSNDDEAKWATKTRGAPVHHMVMQDDGDLVINDADGKTLWRTNTGESGSSKSSKFADGRSRGTVTSTREASGLAASRRHPGVLYAADDSGGKPELYVIDSTDGKTLGTITISGVTNKDWEDLAVGPCGDDRGGYCIYIGDVGGNVGSPKFTIYKVREPSQIKSQSLSVDSEFLLDWDAKNCEAVMVDAKGEVYLISKSQTIGKLYKLPKSGWGQSSRTKVRSIGTLPTTGPVRGSDMSPNGQEIIVRYPNRIYYWRRESGESVRDAMMRAPEEVPVEKEPQGEALTFSVNGDGYYTLSERRNQPLYFYKRV